MNFHFRTCQQKCLEFSRHRKTIVRLCSNHSKSWEILMGSNFLWPAEKTVAWIMVHMDEETLAMKYATCIHSMPNSGRFNAVWIKVFPQAGFLLKKSDDFHLTKSPEQRGIFANKTRADPNGVAWSTNSEHWKIRYILEMRSFSNPKEWQNKKKPQSPIRKTGFETSMIVSKNLKKRTQTWLKKNQLPQKQLNQHLFFAFGGP